jgi:hypothetical protein
MRKSRFWIAWAVGNLTWLVGAPFLLSLWVTADELASGAAISSERDSPKILMAGFVMLNAAVVLLVNVTWGVVALVRRRRRKGSSPRSG